jgi:hypothetical protein
MLNQVDILYPHDDRVLTDYDLEGAPISAPPGAIHPASHELASDPRIAFGL